MDSKQVKSQRIGEYVEKMKAIKNLHDIEYAHVAADELLCQLLKLEGYSEVVETYEQVGKYYA